MQSAVQKNRFAAAMQDDSDDELVVQKQTKTQKKKEERKITEKVDKPLKVNTAQMVDGDGGQEFQMSGVQEKTRGTRGGRGGARGGGDREERGGRGGQRGGRGGRGRGDRPNTAAAPRRDADGAPVRLDAQGKPIRGASRNDGGQFRGRGQREPGERPYRGREGAAHEGYERRSGAGRGTRQPTEKKEGAGRFNTGQRQYQVKGEEGEENAEATEETKAAAGEPEAEAKKPVKEEKKEAEPEYVEEILGVSLDDFMAGRTATEKARARDPEQITGKTKASEQQKQKQSTVQQSQYMKNAVHAGKGADDQLMNFASVPDEDEAQAARGGDRGGRGGKRRGGERGGAGERGGRPRQPKSTKQTLKKTEEDYPTL